ncbi:MAG: protein kinase, partial [Acidobacteriia bacterium]|nr:protein kinase [Terriglobia bacterium]
MQAERWERIKQVYNSALRIEPQQREAFLDEACAGDEWLRREIEQLLAQGSQADGFLESPALEIAARAIAVEEQGSELAGRALLHYRVIEKIGEGGMGVVYRARDERLQRDVAIKVLAGAALPNERARTQLLREARAAAALNHPNICTVHEAGNADGHAYVAMELVEGKSVSALLEQGPLSFEHTVRYGVQLADALAHAHPRGIVHRDLKSANVVVNREGRAKVLDFGLAKRLDVRAWNEITRSQATETAPGMVAGTLAYMAPEQLRGEAADVRSDIWSLGVVLYEMAAGVRPFRGRTWSELSSAILNEGPAPLPGRASGALWAVIGRCLEKNPQRRYQTADDARAALDALQTGSASLWATWSSMPPRRRLLGLAVLPPILAALLAAVHPAWFRQALGKGPPRVRTVAVLPLEDLTPGSQEGYLAEGLHEALITDLHRLNGLRVIARP